ncbi:MAG: UDP-3-O-(3-hydroxymyristoyl)glucosamine N-acyltransferase [Deinococcales bacterium]
MTTSSHESSTLAAELEGTATGPTTAVHRLTTVEAAGAGSVVVAADADALARALARGPAAVVVPRGLILPQPPPCTVIEVDDARRALARLTALFDQRPRPAAEVHATAVIAADATLGDDVAVGPNSVIESGAVIGHGTRIGPNCSVGAGARIGHDCRLHAGVVLYDGVELGDRVELHSGCVVGADGFGYAESPRGALKIHHLGGVVLGDDVEIGANSAVDRGTLEPTRIGPRTKIDNHCQVGHNVAIGSDCLIAGMTGIAGSCTLGDRVILGG